MDHLTREELTQLTSMENKPSVSIYMPLHRTPGENEQDPIRLRNLLDEAQKQLAATGMRSPAVRELLEPIRDLQKQRSFWGPSADEGLAVLFAPDFHRHYRLPYPVPDSVDVGGSFRIAPLAHQLLWEQTFYVFALAEKHVKLYRCDRRAISPVDLPAKMPASIQEALAGTELEKSLQHHTSASGDLAAARVGIVHGHGTPKDHQKVLLNDYFKIVANHLDQLLKNGHAPVVLAAVDYYHPMFHQACKHPHLLKDGISGSPDELKDNELHQRALPLVEPWFRQAREQAVARYNKLAGNDRTSDDIETIVPAAQHGRVEALFAEMGTRVWGTFVPDDGNADIHDERQAGDVDLLDLAVKRSLANGGDVYVVPTEEVPADAAVAAIFRW